ncbi:MAG TPA: tRNA uridine-5-carboxymethylaminomethyl(34) synthesis GTPase MnmE [Opitutaceae bacterium]
MTLEPGGEPGLGVPMARATDTIAAHATPTGASALALVRVSGPESTRLARDILGALPPARHAIHADYVDVDSRLVDDVVATRFEAPHSYTGEDSLELCCHGSPLVVRKLLGDLMARGCRPAAPGEFTQRAFLNGRMDLSQAEAVMDVISARSERALSAAQQVLRGALGRILGVLIDEILAALAQVEAYIDFPDEDLPPEDASRLEAALRRAIEGASQLLATERTGLLLRDGITTVILGEPNAGKSSLMNRLVGSERSIVSPEAGTTRDFIEERASAGPHGLRLIDTAGLNPAAAGVERLGVERTSEQAAEADLFILVLDAARPTPALPPEILSRIKDSNTIVALNKSDLLGPREAAKAALPAGLAAVRVSALSGAGFPELVAGLERLAAGLETTAGEERIAVNVRHAHFLAEAKACLAAALAKIPMKGAPELLASDLRGALSALGEISGKVDNERMLDQLFASFCIGK